MEYFNGGALFAVPVKTGEELEPSPPHKLAIYPRDVTSWATFGDGGHRLVSIGTDRRPRDIRLILD